MAIALRPFHLSNMPASRTKKCSATAQTNASVPVPRITDPYAPRDEDDVYPETSAEKAATEEVRADFNRKIVLLQKKHGASRCCGLSVTDVNPRDAGGGDIDIECHWG